MTDGERRAFDQYAAAALQALIMRADVLDMNPYLNAERITKWAGEWAEWMLKERSKRTDDPW